MKSPDMDSNLSGFVLDPTKCGSLSLKQKREFVYELTKCSQDPLSMLQSWSRRDLIEVLCAEMGKERKYTGLTKHKLVENLMNLLSARKSGMKIEEVDCTMPPPLQDSSKRQRKGGYPSTVPAETNHNKANSHNEIYSSLVFCQNIACRATISLEDVFCKRCSCCICFKFDDNKDPSLWLVCNSCGISCHLECAFKHEKAGITKTEHQQKLDGSFYCVSCRKVNNLLGCWKKQLIIAKDARRVDTLYHRLSLSHKLLDGTELYQKLHEIVHEALIKLESDVGTPDVSNIMARSIVNRLSSGAEVQKLCVLALESLDLLLSTSQKTNLFSSSSIRFEDVSTTSVCVVVDLEDKTSDYELSFSVWYRDVNTVDYPMEPTCHLPNRSKKALVSDMCPATKYLFKVVAFDTDGKEMGVSEAGIETKGIIEDNHKSVVIRGTSPKPNYGSPKTNSSGLSDESNNAMACKDLNKLPEECPNTCEKHEITNSEKSSDIRECSYSQSHDTCVHTNSSRNEDAPGHCSSALDEEPNLTMHEQLHVDTITSAGRNPVSDFKRPPSGNEMAITIYNQLESGLPVTPSILEFNKECAAKNIRGKLCNVVSNHSPKPINDSMCFEKDKPVHNKGSSLQEDYEYCVKIVRWLECKGHIETNFRVKFLTWFSLRATIQERRVVSVFVDTLIDDPPSLAGQLIDAFSDGISNKKPPMNGEFCTKLFH